MTLSRASCCAVSLVACEHHTCNALRDHGQGGSRSAFCKLAHGGELWASRGRGLSRKAEVAFNRRHLLKMSSSSLALTGIGQAYFIRRLQAIVAGGRRNSHVDGDDPLTAKHCHFMPMIMD